MNPLQAIASAQLDDGVVLAGAWRGAAGRPLPRDQPVDLRFGDAMMAALGARRTDAAVQHPALEGRVADPNPLGGGPDRHERPGRLVPHAVGDGITGNSQLEYTTFETV